MMMVISCQYRCNVDFVYIFMTNIYMNIYDEDVHGETFFLSCFSSISQR